MADETCCLAVRGFLEKFPDVEANLPTECPRCGAEIEFSYWTNPLLTSEPRFYGRTIKTCGPVYVAASCTQCDWAKTLLE